MFTLQRLPAGSGHRHITSLPTVDSPILSRCQSVSLGSLHTHESLCLRVQSSPRAVLLAMSTAALQTWKQLPGDSGNPWDLGFVWVRATSQVTLQLKTMAQVLTIFKSSLI